MMNNNYATYFVSTCDACSFQVMLKCPSRGNMPGLVAQVYTDHCVDNTDKVAVQALVETLAKYATLPIDQVSNGVVVLYQCDMWSCSVISV
ncbi:hypothetical protein DPMN_059074 [Dreissena polymorpha]|uniref:Uncharacterized protein n=1 Tax=Dreissena polymorpha TaxID=45954 RepID=A0A9D4C3E4_DREPO|nr:hypothetical protein DPMN_059074 [Dreissena polymorpha]